MYNFGENAIDIKTGNDLNIYNNDTYRGSYDLGGTGGGLANISTHGGGYWPSYGVSNVTIRDNYFHDSRYMAIRLLNTGGTNSDYDIYNNYFESVGSAIIIQKITNVSFYNNLINMDENLDCTNFNLALYIFNQASPGLRIYNNSFYISNTYTMFGIGFNRHSSTTAEIKNNIIQMITSSSGRYSLYVYSGEGALPDVSNNAYYNANHKNRVYWAGTVYDSSEQASWRSAGHTDGIFSDPKYKDPLNGDFALSNDSPCILPNKKLGAQLPLNASGSGAILASPETLGSPKGLKIMIN
jgi:hypothetical protein